MVGMCRAVGLVLLYISCRADNLGNGDSTRTYVRKSQYNWGWDWVRPDTIVRTVADW